MSKNRLLIGSNIFILFVLIFIFLPLNVDFALKNASEEAVKRIEKSIAPYRERGVSLSVEVSCHEQADDRGFPFVRGRLRRLQRRF